MKTLKQLAAVAVIGVLMFLVGCGNDSTNHSSSTNSITGASSSTNDTVNNNNPVVGMTNLPAITNQ